MKKIVLFIGCICISVWAHCLNAKEVLEKIRSNYQDKHSFEMQLEYQVYKGFSGNDVRESYSSVYKKNDQQSYRQLGDFEFIHTPQLSLLVDHAQHTLTLSDPVAEDFPEADYKQSLKQCSQTLVNKEQEGTMTLSMQICAGSDLPYAALTITVDKDYWIRHLVLFYRDQVDFSGSYFNPEKDYVRLEISYGKLKENWKDKEQKAEISGYLSSWKDTLIAVPSLEKYTIYDYRTNAKNE